MSIRVLRCAAIALAIAATGCLFACGGGGSSTDSSTPAPPLPPPPPLLPPGTLDPAFGIGGIVALPERSPPSAATVRVIAIQKDGKIVAAGLSGFFPVHSPTERATLARYNADGMLDPGFGVGGVFDLRSASSAVDLGEIEGVALQTDGKIVAAARTFTDGCIVVRINANGTLDATFGPASHPGVVVLNPPELRSRCNAVAVQADGRIVVAGIRMTYDTAAQQYRNSILVARLGADGAPDPTFARGAGEVVTSAGWYMETIDMKLDSHGRIVVAANAKLTTGYEVIDTLLARYTAQGIPDPDFRGGLSRDLVGPRHYQSRGIALQPDDGIVVAGSASALPGEPFAPGFALARVLASGSIDPDFGAQGSVVTTFDEATSVAVQQNGKIVAVGRADLDALVARFGADGRPDKEFGSGGGARNSTLHEPVAVAIQRDGGIVTANSVGYKAGIFEFARYIGDPTISLSGRSER